MVVGWRFRFQYMGKIRNSASGCKDVWMDGWMDGWVDGWMDRWIDG